jgi:hypothetical protein
MERYELLENGLKDTIAEVNTLIDERVVQVNDEIVELDFFLGGDVYTIVSFNDNGHECCTL